MKKIKIAILFGGKSGEHEVSIASALSIYRTFNRKKYEQFIKKYPENNLIPEAQFGVASCLEALGHLEDAIVIYRKIQNLYPSRHAIESKIKRISRRMLEQKRSR